MGIPNTMGIQHFTISRLFVGTSNSRQALIRVGLYLHHSSPSLTHRTRQPVRNMSTLEDLDDLERDQKEEKKDGDDKKKKKITSTPRSFNPVPETSSTGGGYWRTN